MSSETPPQERRPGQKGRGIVPALCNILGTLILISAILVCLPAVAPQVLGYEVFCVVSGSMEPAIPVGSAVFVKNTPPEEIGKGDVIAFRSGDSVITHRVTANHKVEGEFSTKGDANEGEDMNRVPYEALMGEVEHQFPMLGDLLTVLTSTLGKVYMLCFAACGAMLNILAGRLRARRR